MCLSFHGKVFTQQKEIETGHDQVRSYSGQQALDRVIIDPHMDCTQATGHTHESNEVKNLLPCFDVGKYFQGNFRSLISQ